MIELHSNFTFEGFKTSVDGLYPDNHQLHETIRNHARLHGLVRNGLLHFHQRSKRVGCDWVGDHIRPRFRIPESWKWPVGVSISNEIIGGFEYYGAWVP
jgi:hypothetical protein